MPKIPEIRIIIWSETSISISNLSKVRISRDELTRIVPSVAIGTVRVISTISASAPITSKLFISEKKKPSGNQTILDINKIQSFSIQITVITVGREDMAVAEEEEEAAPRNWREEGAERFMTQELSYNIHVLTKFLFIF